MDEEDDDELSVVSQGTASAETNASSSNLSRSGSLRKILSIGATTIANVATGQQDPLTAFANASAAQQQQHSATQGQQLNAGVQRQCSLVRITSSDPTSKLCAQPIQLELQAGGGLALPEKGTTGTLPSQANGLPAGGSASTTPAAGSGASGAVLPRGAAATARNVHASPSASPSRAAPLRPARRRKESGKLAVPRRGSLNSTPTASVDGKEAQEGAEGTDGDDKALPTENGKSATGSGDDEHPSSRRRTVAAVAPVAATTAAGVTRRLSRGRLAGTSSLRNKRRSASAGMHNGTNGVTNKSLPGDSTEEETTETEKSGSEDETPRKSRTAATGSASPPLLRAPTPILKRVPEKFNPSQLEVGAAGERLSMSSADAYAPKAAPAIVERSLSTNGSTSPAGSGRDTPPAPSPIEKDKRSLSPTSPAGGISRSASPSSNQLWPAKRPRLIKLTEPDWRPYVDVHDRARERQQAAFALASQLKTSASSPDLVALRQQQVQNGPMLSLNGLPGLVGSESGGSNSSSQGTSSADEEFWFERFTRSTAAAGKDWDWRKRRMRQTQQAQAQANAQAHAQAHAHATAAAAAAGAAAWHQAMMHQQNGRPYYSGQDLDMGILDGHLQRVNRGSPRQGKAFQGAPLVSFSQSEVQNGPTVAPGSLLDPLVIRDNPSLLNSTLTRAHRRAGIRNISSLGTDGQSPPPSPQRTRSMDEDRAEVEVNGGSKRTGSSFRKMMGLRSTSPSQDGANGKASPAGSQDPASNFARIRSASTPAIDADVLAARQLLDVPNRFSSLKPKGKRDHRPIDTKRLAVAQLLAEADAFTDTFLDDESDGERGSAAAGRRSLDGSSDRSSSPTFLQGPPAGAWGGRRRVNSTIESLESPRSSADAYGSGTSPTTSSPQRGSASMDLSPRARAQARSASYAGETQGVTRNGTLKPKRMGSSPMMRRLASEERLGKMPSY